MTPDELNAEANVMDALDVIAEISWAERQAISPDMVRRVLHLLCNVVHEETGKGRRVEVELLGTFSRSSAGLLVFDEEQGRDWPSLNRIVEWSSADAT